MSEYKVFQPMKYATARNKDVLKEALESDNYGIQLKVDGSSYVWAKDMDGSVHLYGDKVSKKTGEIIDKIDNCPHLKAFAEQNFPKGSQLIVEIACKYNWTANKWDTHSSSKYVNSIMLCTPQRAAARQNDIGWVDAYVFDILFWDGEPMYKKDFADRYGALMILKDKWKDHAVTWLSFAQLFIQNKSEKIAEWLASGEEGGVLKLLNSQGRLSAAHYVSEIGETPKRPMHVTYKIKQVDTVDVVIMGIQEPDKAYTGKDPENYPYRDDDGNPVNRLWALHMANGFVIGLFDEHGELIKIGTVASGLDDAMRKDAIDNPEKYIGQTIEVDCMSVDHAGRSLRHPRLMKMRPDKQPALCTLKEVFS